MSQVANFNSCVLNAQVIEQSFNMWLNIQQSTRETAVVGKLR